MSETRFQVGDVWECRNGERRTITALYPDKGWMLTAERGGRLISGKLFINCDHPCDLIHLISRAGSSVGGPVVENNATASGMIGVCMCPLSIDGIVHTKSCQYYKPADERQKERYRLENVWAIPHHTGPKTRAEINAEHSTPRDSWLTEAEKAWEKINKALEEME